MPVSRDEVVWAYRLILEREPQSEDVTSAQMEAHASVSDLVASFISAPEVWYRLQKPRDYSIPLFLVPSGENGVITIDEPTLAKPVSQPCTYSQMQEPQYHELLQLIDVEPGYLHRKYWEWAYIVRVFETMGMAEPGRRGLVFAVGDEPIPSILAARGCEILATDAPPEIGNVWAGQYSEAAESLWRKKIIDRQSFDARVTFRAVDMLDIPEDLHDFDFLWSSCSIEHLGGIAPACDFIKKSLTALKPGGIAVHTTEFNLSSNDETVDTFPTCIFRRRDIEALRDSLLADGHDVAACNFWPGGTPVDAHIDFPPYGPPHMKLALYQFVSTSFGIVITKAA